MMWRGLDLCCPVCKGDLREDGSGAEPELDCPRCDRRYPVILGIPDFRIFADPYIELDADRAKGRRLAERFGDLGFADLVRFYYSISPANTPAQAQAFTAGHLAAVPRARASLDAWEREGDSDVEHIPRDEREGGGGRAPAQTLALRALEVGCGTAPLLVAAAPRYRALAGVDIAFRWLVVGKKRLEEAGVDVPLIAACAEALPLRDTAFDRVIGDSLVENVRDQRQALGEMHRVLAPSGRLFLSTSNRYSVGPDPQTGLWAVGYLPRRVVAAHMRRQQGLPPARNLLSVFALSRALARAGFARPRVSLPTFPAEQRARFRPLIRRLVDTYHAAARLPGSRHLLYLIGPKLYAVSEKGQPAPRWHHHVGGRRVESGAGGRGRGGPFALSMSAAMRHGPPGARRSARTNLPMSGSPVRSA